MKKTLSFIALMSMTLTALSYTNLEKDAATFMAGKGFIVDNKTQISAYRLGDTITRKEVMKIIANLDGGIVPKKCEGLFSDVANDWGCKYIERALSKKYIAANTKFRPNDTITIPEALKLILKVRQIEQKYTSSVWQANYVQAAYDAALIDTVYQSGYFTKNTTRGFIFSVISRSYDDFILPPKDTNIDTSSQIKSTTNTSIVIDYKGTQVPAIIDSPGSSEVDVILTFHGSAVKDAKVLDATKRILENTRRIIKKENVMIISVAYPEEGLLFGDNIREAEAALLWTKYNASEELGVKINKVYLLGHSQGGYLVTRLNTLHETDGVIANGAGPIDLGFRCKLDEDSGATYYNEFEKEKSSVCDLLKQEYGSVFDNPAPYTSRSMINFASGYKSKILFVQGMQDGEIQMALRPKFKEKLSQCVDCAEYEFFEVENLGHTAAFEDEKAMQVINSFLFD